MKNWRSIYRMEIWITVICFTLLVFTGGMISSFFVLTKDAFFAGESPAFYVKSYTLGFPTHYFLLVVLSWLGATLIGAVWALFMDKMERDIN